MASELLAIPEEYIEDVILIIRTGIRHRAKMSKTMAEIEATKQLEKWCRKMMGYMRGDDL